MQGSMVPVLQKHIQSSSRKRWDPSGIGSLEETDCCLKDISKFRDASGNEERPKISVFQHLIEGSVLSGISIYIFQNKRLGCTSGIKRLPLP